MKALLHKDFRNAKMALPPAVLLGIPLLLIIEFTQSPYFNQKVSWQSAFWIVYFFSSTSLFYRSFGFENRFKTFHIYKSFGVPSLQIFLSQTLVHFLSASFMGLSYLLLTFIMWSPSDLNLCHFILSIITTSAILSPLGTTLGLMLQVEREFLFSLIFLPLSTPVILGAYSYGLQSESAWPWVLGMFFVGSCFLSSAVFHFFFDDLTA